MKFTFSIFVLFFSMCALYAQEVSFDAIYEKDGLTYIKGSNELFTGKVVAFYPNGKKSLEIEYKNGIESGTNRNWYANGNIANETQIDSSKIDGLWIDYYPNGVKQNEVTYETDYMNGPCVRRYENGNISEEGSYAHCREEGLWKYYWENGNKKAEGYYHEASKTGEWKYWDEQGKESATEIPVK